MNVQQMVKLCECSCGEPTLVAVRSRKAIGHVKGQPLRFIDGHQLRVRHTGPSSCSVTGCANTVRSNGLCGTHHRRWKLYGDPRVVTRQAKRFGCNAEGCAGQHAAGGYCSKHYTRLLRHGNLVGQRPHGPAEERYWRHVNQTGACWLWTGSIADTGYGVHWTDDRKLVGAHRYSYELLAGSIPEGLHLDHLCRVRNCVNPAHLEPVTPAENARRGVESRRAEAAAQAEAPAP